MIAIAFAAYPRPDDRGLCRRRIREAATSTAALSSASGGGWPSRCRGTTSPTTSRPRRSARASSRASRAGTFELVRSVIGANDPYTVRQACLAMEAMDLSPLVPRIERPLLMTNGTHDILCPPEFAPSGLGARQMAELNQTIRVFEFPDIGHADLLECPDDAVRIVTAFFHEALDRDLRPPRRRDPA